MAFNRVIEMIVGSSVINTGTGLKMSDLNLEFDITRSVFLSANSAYFKIYNAKLDTINKFLVNSNTIIFKAGYDDENNLGTIFTGSIIDSKTQKQGTERITEIQAIDFIKTGITYNTISISYAKNTPIATILNDLAATLSVTLSGISNVPSDLILQNGFVYAGNRRNLLVRLQKLLNINGVGFYFDNAEFVVYKLGIQDSTFGVARVTPNSGLIGNVQLIIDEDTTNTNKRVEFTSLINPKLKPNSVVTIAEAVNAGTYALEKVRYYGDNFGGDFLCDCEGVA